MEYMLAVGYTVVIFFFAFLAGNIFVVVKIFSLFEQLMIDKSVFLHDSALLEFGHGSKFDLFHVTFIGFEFTAVLL